MNTPANEPIASPSLFRNPADLLGLLRAGHTPQTARQASSISPQSRPVSAADLVAGFGRKPNSITSVSSPSVVAPSASRPDLRGEAALSSSNPQDFLLRLLNNQAKTETFSPTRQVDSPAKLNDSVVGASDTTSLETVTGSSFAPVSLENTPFTADISTHAKSVTKQNSASSPHGLGLSQAQPFAFGVAHRSSPGLFTASNPFDQLSRSSSRPQEKTTKKLEPQQAESALPSSTLAVPSITTLPETVSEAVEEAGEKAEKQVEEALAHLHLDAPHSKSISVVVKESVNVTEEMEIPDLSLVPGNWEDAAADDDEEYSVKIYNMPMQPFISIDVLVLAEPPAKIPASAILNCVRFNKGFDQVDRNLVSGTSKHLVYALKEKGFRVIDLNTAKYKGLFPEHAERIFNISLSMTKASSDEANAAVLATGVNGTVFWMPFTRFDTGSSDPAFILSPSESGEEHTSNSQLKTRVKSSTRHPEYFAYGRGKFIQLIYPSIATQPAFTDPKTELLDTQKYFKEENIRISTGKAAKDFAFSADDTVIASLDKAGKLKFWDIQSLTERRAGVPAGKIEVNTPIMTFNTCSKSEKAWPTSVIFIDKGRPTTDGYALRYMFVGMKQNHSLQLWDLRLNQQVQEINFPHQDESDAICSLAFHAKHGILVVGHPTRNSIYILHVSPPKYDLPPYTQAQFLSMVASKDPTLPRPKSTVIVSSIREYSLNDRGILRSLDIKVDWPPAEDSISSEKDYVMSLICYHSKGIFQFTMMRKQMGWTKEGKPIESIEAGEDNVKVRALVQPPQNDAASVNGDTTVTNGAFPKAEEAPKVVEPVSSAQPSPEKKREKRKKLFDPNSSSSKAGSKAGTDSETPASSRNTPQVQEPPVIQKVITTNNNHSATTEKQIVTSVERVLSERFTLLQNRLEDDRRASEATAAIKEEALLKQLSQAIPQSVEKTLKGIVSKSLSETLESMKENIANTVDRTVTTAFANAIKHALPREIEKMAPIIANKLGQDQGLLRALANNTTKEVTNSITKDFQKFSSEIAPFIEHATTKSTTQTATAIDQRIAIQLKSYESRRQADAQKIDALTAHVNNLNNALRELVEQQAIFKSEVMNQLAKKHAASASTGILALPAPEVDILDEIKACLLESNYEDAFVKVCYITSPYRHDTN